MLTGKIARVFTAVGLMAAILPAAVKAVPLAPGGAVALPGTTAAAQPWLGGVVVLDTLRPFQIISLSGAVVGKGIVQDRVVRSSVTGTYHYYFRLFNDASSSVALTQVMRQSFAGQFTDVNYRLDGLGVAAPKAAFRDATGSAIRYDFANSPVFPGSTSRFIFAATRAFTVNAGGQMVIYANNGAAKAVTNAYQP